VSAGLPSSREPNGQRRWADEYAEFVRNVSFAAKVEMIAFAAALEAVRRLVKPICSQVDQYPAPALML
jgi:hypothetical protein